MKRTRISTGKLRNLLLNCNDPNDLKFAIKGVNFYQTNQQDFSEEIGSLFLKACVRCKNPVAYVALINKKQNRIGAWTTTKSINLLINSISELENLDNTIKLEKVIQALSVFNEKGLKILPETIESAFKIATTTTIGSELNKKFQIVAKKQIVPEENLISLLNLYPLTVVEDVVEKVEKKIVKKEEKKVEKKKGKK
jgi:hypothetical protein